MSKLDYLKKYLTEDDDKKGKKKKKKSISNARKNWQSVIIDDDKGWCDVNVKVGGEGRVEPEEDEEEDDAPTIANLDEIELDPNQYWKQSDKWRPMNDIDNAKSYKQSSKEQLIRDLIRTDHQRVKDEGNKLSSPQTKRHDLLDRSPPRRRTRHDSSDLSPPRSSCRDSGDSSARPSRRRRHDSDDLSPRRIRRESEDLSPPRRQAKHHLIDVSPRQNRRKTAEDSPDLSPLRRRRRHDSSDILPPLKNTVQDSDSDLSPVRRSTEVPKHKDVPVLSSARKTFSDNKQGMARKTAGLQSVKVLKEENERRRKLEDLHFAEMNPEVSGRNAETVYRDKQGKVRNLKQERLQKREERRKKEEEEEKSMEWGRGLVQKKMVENKIADAVHEMNKPFARYADDIDLDKMQREAERAEDPMLDYLKRKKAKRAGGKMKEKPKYKGPPPPPTRFNIEPGYRWDGVDRSNGFEARRFKHINEKKSLQYEAYKWSIEDM